MFVALLAAAAATNSSLNLCYLASLLLGGGLRIANAAKSYIKAISGNASHLIMKGLLMKAFWRRKMAGLLP